ncbi:wd-40 repeat-containing protein [Leptolyngbya sp. Heron Island J]|uniref:AAA-like domain-containing protein n=1 Tax=Leptolyngbya sp. Heron Island J TaxID=1385935 RepID=UPI0003B98284|nr:AAA-like domain-containing protein [Leptolyngbya sp. Heron Island J]ESA34116.1 wd-40 repeat-containing protein [Leptolyngbya sp. Heron Island J]
MADASIYTVGGTVQVNEQGIYIPRQADIELLKLCRESTFAYVLTPRQMGKSSLMIRTAERLTDEEIQAVIIDLTQIGTQVSADEWYSDFLDLVASQLMLSTDVKVWWQANSQSGLTHRFIRFFQEMVLAEISDPLVIFVDEIDTTLSLDFTDDFYAAIRYLYVARATDPELRKISFVLIGVATPADLISDSKRTPFNIGQRIDLTDFTIEEAQPLAYGLNLEDKQARAILEGVLEWTEGHPYLTQRVCADIARDLQDEERPTDWTETDTARVVRRNFFGVKSEQDNNLQFVRDMLIRQSPNRYKSEVLNTYSKICYGRRNVRDEAQSIVKSHLKLSGIVKKNGKLLKVRNKIYQTVFSRKWIYEHLSADWLKKIKTTAFLGAVIFVILLIPFSIYADHQRRLAEEQRRQAIEQRTMVEEQRKIAEEQRKIAEEQRKIAEEQRQVIEDLFLGQLAKTAKEDLDPRVKAFLDTIAWSLRTQSLPSNYDIVLDGSEFEDFSDHPRKRTCVDSYFGLEEICGYSAGRYHIIPETWDWVADQLNLNDFSPASQDLAAIELLREKGSLDQIETGNFKSAVYNASSYWVTLPDSDGESYYADDGYQARSIDNLQFMYDLFYARYLLLAKE